MPYGKSDRDPERFYREQTAKLTSIADTYEEEKSKYENYFKPHLIFKIKLTQDVPDISFRAELRKAGIETLSSASNKMHYWVVFADSSKFEKFRARMSKYVSERKIAMEKMLAGGAKNKDEIKGTFMDAISSVEEIPSEEKLGESLRKAPVGKRGHEYLDVETWLMEPGSIEKFTAGLSRLVEERRGEIADRAITKNFYVIRIKCDSRMLDEITSMREVCRVDRPPSIRLEDTIAVGLEDLEVALLPDADSPGILVVDSGMRDHPLIRDSIFGKISIPSRQNTIAEELNLDDAGHGTQVAGVALYGDVLKCAESRAFRPQIKLYSAKVMRRGPGGRAVFDERSLLENQLKNSVEDTIKRHPDCRIINISFGNEASKMAEGQRQFRIASLIDELAADNPEIMFTISSGNTSKRAVSHDAYSKESIDSLEFKIFDPATSVHGLTVGSVNPLKTPTMHEGQDYPSYFSTFGPGLNGMIKPDLVDYGGGYGGDVVTVNPNWTSEGRLFTRVRGTSLSAPKIAHYLALLRRSFPDFSRNLIMALLLSSSNIPEELPHPLDVLRKSGKAKDLKYIFDVYGMGKPDLDKALHSDPNRVMFTYEGKIDVGSTDIFTVNLPKEFITEKGRRSIEVTLVYDPPVNSNRADYLGDLMEYHLFKNASPNEINASFKRLDPGSEDTAIPDSLKNKELCMSPGIRLRSKGAHQKSTRVYKVRPRIDTGYPLVLVVRCKNKWLPGREKHRQSYSVIVSIAHSKRIDLYAMIKARNMPRAKVR